MQGELEGALAKQPPGAAVPRSVVVAGRTDAGVHAARQVVHVDVEPYEGQPTSRRLTVDERGLPDLDRMRHRWNRILPPDVRVLDTRVAPDGFDARFSAVRRHYRYQVSDAPWGVDPLRRRDTLAHPRPLDVDALQQASQDLLGLQDFAAYCKHREGATTIRELQRFTWRRVGEYEVHAEVSADAFCHSMVRSLVGALLMVGDGRRDVEWPHRVLDSQVRESAVAPAHGLTLVAIDYPPDAHLATRATQTRALRDTPRA
ncbi:pseudouridylate synthase [Prauserella sp. Am3]|nr:pseudouridylate synthase [Prauserella sp. Am3]